MSSSRVLKYMPDLEALSFEQLICWHERIRYFREDYIPWNDLGDRLTVDPMGEAIKGAEDSRWSSIKDLGLSCDEEIRRRSELNRADLDLTFRFDRAIHESAGEALRALEVRVCDLKVWVRATAATKDQARLRRIIKFVVPDGALVQILFKAARAR
jgi:hypothetical protein